MLRRFKLVIFGVMLGALMMPAVPVVCHAAAHTDGAEALHARDCADHHGEHSAKHHVIPHLNESLAILTPASKELKPDAARPTHTDGVLVLTKNLFQKDLRNLSFELDLSHCYWSQQVRLSHFATAPPA